MSAAPAFERLGRRFSLVNRSALVTGGAMSMGRAIAIVLAEAGADVAITTAPAADAKLGLAHAAEETRAEIASLGRKSAVIAADFNELGAARRTVAEAEAALGKVDVLVICASIQTRQPFAQVDATEITRQVTVNFNSTVELLQAALPGMAKRGWGRVLSIGSINETRPEIELAIYAALKAAQHNLIRNLARQYADKGVNLNTIAPGLVATERNRWRRQDAADWARIQHGVNPMHRAGLPDEIANAALFFCSEAASFCTGANLEITGGHQL
jgi:NAD(P)-dependent dehydrogenase (short-subunit alcohol dehydrogenase family)